MDSLNLAANDLNGSEHVSFEGASSGLNGSSDATDNRGNAITINQDVPASSTSRAARKSSSARAKPAKLPANIIQPASFIDTLSLLTLFDHLPSLMMVVVHTLYLASFFSNTSVSLLSTRSIFGWSSSVTSTSSTSQRYSSPMGSNVRKSLSLMVSKALLIDVCIALLTLYVTPLLRNVVMVFAHAIVAASLGGGGQRVVTNAIYSTTAVEILQFVWGKIRFYMFADDILDPMMLDSHHHHHHLLFDDELFSVATSQSFNTLTSAWALMSTIISFITHMDWQQELPLICFQTIAVHVIGLGLVPFIRKVFPERGGNIDVTLDTLGDVSNDSFIDPTASYSYTPDSSADMSFMRGQRTTISVPFQRGHTKRDSYSYSLNHSDFDFLYAPSVKKNKRLGVVRANQPLWSTLASSIVLAARHESEVLDRDPVTAREEMGAIGYGQCYVRYIFESSVAFKMVNFPPMSYDCFFVRVNGIQWPQVSVTPFSADEEDDDVVAAAAAVDTNVQPPFLVVVYGLTPISQYEMEMVCDHDNGPVTCHRVNISTSARRNSNAGSSVAPARPVSPVTTLLDTLTTTQITLSEEKLRLKRARKDHTKRLASLRSEIESLRSKIEASDKGDERNSRKVLSLRESVRQLEDEIDQISRSTDALDQRQHDSITQFDSQKQEWEARIGVHQETKDTHNRIRDEWEKKEQALTLELNALAAKCDKLAAKKLRLLTDVEKLEADCLGEIKNEIEGREARRQEKLVRRKKLEEEFSNNIGKLETVVENTNARTADLMRVYPQAASMGPLSVGRNSGSIDSSLQSTPLLPQPLSDENVHGFDNVN
jgi:hypothetical protein